MINWIRGSIVAFKLRELEVQRNGLLHNLGGERRIGVNVIKVSQGDVVELLNPSIHPLQFLIEDVISIVDLGRLLTIDGEDFFWRRIMI